MFSTENIQQPFSLGQWGLLLDLEFGFFFFLVTALHEGSVKKLTKVLAVLLNGRRNALETRKIDRECTKCRKTGVDVLRLIEGFYQQYFCTQMVTKVIDLDLV